MSNKKRFIIDYLDASDDLSHVWVMADNATQAEQIAKSEWWDIAEIISIRPSNETN